MRSPAPANVRILLPSGYGARPRRRYPILYLLHGTDGGAADWTAMGGAERSTAGRPLIVVMPDIGLDDDGGGWCTDWYNAGARGRPEWERFHINQLIPLVDHNLRTIAARAGRAIAGLSQGGFCAMSYAARHPDLFSAALSFSGALDIAYGASAQAMETPIINLIETELDKVAANSILGPRSTQEINWADHDPTTLAENLPGMRLTMYTGDGRPGPLDTGPVSALDESQETDIHELTLDFHRRLQALRIPSTLHDYGPGALPPPRPLPGDQPVRVRHGPPRRAQRRRRPADHPRRARPVRHGPGVPRRRSGARDDGLHDPHIGRARGGPAVGSPVSDAPRIKPATACGATRCGRRAARTRRLVQSRVQLGAACWEYALLGV